MVSPTALPSRVLPLTVRSEAVTIAPVLPSTVKLEVSTAIPPSRLTRVVVVAPRPVTVARVDVLAIVTVYVAPPVVVMSVPAAMGKVIVLFATVGSVMAKMVYNPSSVNPSKDKGEAPLSSAVTVKASVAALPIVVLPLTVKSDAVTMAPVLPSTVKLEVSTAIPPFKFESPVVVIIPPVPILQLSSVILTPVAEDDPIVIVLPLVAPKLNITAVPELVPASIETAPDVPAELPEVILIAPVVPEVVVVPVERVNAPEAAEVALPVERVVVPVAVPESAAPVKIDIAPDNPDPLPAPVVNVNAPPVPFVARAAPPVKVIAPPLPVAPAPPAPAVSTRAPPAVSAVVLSVICIV